jgi:hypothetical protein
MMKSIGYRLAEGYMWEAMSRGAKESLARAKQIITPAMENLKDIAESRANLVDSSGSLITESSNSAFAIRCSTSDYSTTFNEDAPEDWTVDGDKLDDISDERE